MDAHSVPVLAFPGDAVKILNPQQQENPFQMPEIECIPHHNRKAELQTEGSLVLHNADRTKSWRVDRNSFDIERLYIPRTTGADENDDPSGGSSHANPPHVPSKNIMLLALGALGVVFGDIGTSPLYTVQTIFLNIPATPDNVIGAISSIFWLLNLTVTLKYVIVIMRADNRGEGGIMALTALASQSTQTLTRPWWKTMTMMIGDPPFTPPDFSGFLGNHQVSNNSASALCLAITFIIE